MTGDIDHFADEKQSFDVQSLHRLAGQFVGIDAAGRYLCRFGALVVGWLDHPSVNLLFPFCEGFVVPGCRWMVLQPAFSESSGQNSLERIPRGGEVAKLGSADRRRDLAIWREIETDGLALLPIGRDLQDRWAAQTAMGDQQFFAEGMMI